MQVTLSKRLPNGSYITKTITVTDEPRPGGWLNVNSHAIWIHRFVRDYFGTGAHPAGDWIPRTRAFDITPARRRLVKKFIAKEPC